MSLEKIRVTVIPNGPIKIENGSFEFTDKDGNLVEKDAPFTLCRCGASKNKLFCDGGHKAAGFEG